MTNFIFKSQATFKKISNQLEMILSEQRHQRSDLKQLQIGMAALLNDVKLQKQVEDFYSTPPVEEEKVIHPEDMADLD